MRAALALQPPDRVHLLTLPRRKKNRRVKSGETTSETCAVQLPSTESAIARIAQSAAFVGTWLLIAVCSTGLGLATLAGKRHLERTQYFSISQIDVAGVAPHLVEELQIDLDALRGTSIFDLDTAALATSLRGLSWVKQIAVSRHLPNRIVVAITPRKAIAAIAVGKGQSTSRKRLLIDEQGIPFSSTDETAVKPLPVVIGFAPMQFPAATSALSQYQNVTHQSMLRPEVSQVQQLSDGGLTFKLAQYDVLLHLPSEPMAFEAALKRFDQIWQHLVARGSNRAVSEIFLNNRVNAQRVIVRMHDSSNHTSELDG